MEHIRKFGRTTFASLMIRNYRLYFIGQLVSLSGTWMQTVALGWLVLQITGSGTQVGIVVALQFLPMLLLGPWGGLIADRYDKRNILYLTQIAFLIPTLLLGILVYFESINLILLYVLAVIFGFVRVFDNPARQTFVSELVGDGYIKNAVSLNATVNNLARAIGPSVAGILIAGVGMSFCFLFNAATYVVTIWTLYLMNHADLHVVPKKPKQKGEVREGFRYVMKTPFIRNMLVMMALIGAFVFEFQVSLPILAEHVFHGDAKSYAALMSAMGIGAVVGGIFAASRHSVSSHHFVIFSFFFGVSMVATALMPTLFWATIGMCVVGFFSINTTSLGNTMLQLKSAPEMRGRVMAFWGMAMMGSTPIGGPIIGFIGEFIGGRWGLAVGGFVALFVALYGVFTILKQDRLEKISESVELKTEEMDIQSVKIP